MTVSVAKVLSSTYFTRWALRPGPVTIVLFEHLLRANHDVGLMTLRVGVLWKSTPFVVWFIWISCVGYAAFIFAASFIVYHALHGKLLPSLHLLIVEFIPYLLVDTLEYSYLLGVCISTSTASDSRFRSIGPAIQVAFVVALTALTAFKAYRYHAPIRFFQISSLVSHDMTWSSP